MSGDRATIPLWACSLLRVGNKLELSGKIAARVPVGEALVGFTAADAWSVSFRAAFGRSEAAAFMIAEGMSP